MTAENDKTTVASAGDGHKSKTAETRARGADYIYQPGDPDPLRDGLLKGFWAHRHITPPTKNTSAGPPPPAQPALTPWEHS
jgi:hypothetical protein